MLRIAVLTGLSALVLGKEQQDKEQQDKDVGKELDKNMKELNDAMGEFEREMRKLDKMMDDPAMMRGMCKAMDRENRKGKGEKDWRNSLKYGFTDKDCKNVMGGEHPSWEFAQFNFGECSVDAFGHNSIFLCDEESGLITHRMWKPESNCEGEPIGIDVAYSGTCQQTYLQAAGLPDGMYFQFFFDASDCGPGDGISQEFAEEIIHWINSQGARGMDFPTAVQTNFADNLLLKYMDVDGKVDYRRKGDMLNTLFGLVQTHCKDQNCPNIIAENIEVVKVRGESQILESGYLKFSDFKVYYYATVCQTGERDLKHGLGGWQLCRDVYCEQEECEDMANQFLFGDGKDWHNILHFGFDSEDCDGYLEGYEENHFLGVSFNFDECLVDAFGNKSKFVCDQETGTITHRMWQKDSDCTGEPIGIDVAENGKCHMTRLPGLGNMFFSMNFDGAECGRKPGLTQEFAEKVIHRLNTATSRNMTFTEAINNNVAEQMILLHMDSMGNKTMKGKADFPVLLGGLAQQYGMPDIVEDIVKPVQVDGESMILETGHIDFGGNYVMYYYALVCKALPHLSEAGNLGGWQLCRDVYCEKEECEEMAYDFLFPGREKGEEFTFTVSMVMDKTCDNLYSKNLTGGIYVDEEVVTRRTEECTTNVLGSSVIFECMGDYINEHVYIDATQGDVPDVPDCSGDVLYTMPIRNGCNNYDWGNMLMTWENFCVCEDDEDFEDVNGYSCDDWRGYACEWSMDDNYKGYNKQDVEDVREACCATCTANAKATCMERPAPSLVADNDMVARGMMMRIPDAKDMPDYCGKIWFSGDQEIFEVDPRCCTSEVGAEPWIPLSAFSEKPLGNFEDIEGCYALDPFGNGAITAILVSGCYDSGMQYYGEKCGGSKFGQFTDFAVGQCGVSEETCGCRHFVESEEPGCFSIATPQAEPQLAVFLKMEGCAAPGDESEEQSEDESESEDSEKESGNEDESEDADLLSMTYKMYSRANCAERFETLSLDGELVVANKCMEYEDYYSIMTCKETDLLVETIYEDADCKKPTGVTYQLKPTECGKDSDDDGKEYWFNLSWEGYCREGYQDSDSADESSADGVELLPGVMMPAGGFENKEAMYSFLMEKNLYKEKECPEEELSFADFKEYDSYLRDNFFDKKECSNAGGRYNRLCKAPTKKIKCRKIKNLEVCKAMGCSDKGNECNGNPSFNVPKK